jgi:hypothetical protein
MPMFPKGRSAAELRNLAIWRIDRYVGEDSSAAFAQATSINRELESIRLLVQMHTEYDTQHPHLQALQVILDKYIKLHGAAQEMQTHKQCTHILWHHAWGRLFWLAHKPSWSLNLRNWWMFDIMIKTATGSANTPLTSRIRNESQRAFDLRIRNEEDEERW